MKQLLTALLLTLSMTTAQASPDHDHGAPTFQPKNNGVLQSAHNSHFELALKGKTLNLYVYDKGGKEQPTETYKLNAELEFPKNKKAPLTFKDKKTHWEADFDWNGAHRVTVKVNVDDGKDKDSVKFTLENK